MPEIFIFQINDVEARATFDNRKFIVLKGSIAVGDEGLNRSFLERNENEGRRRLRKQLLAEGKLEKQGNVLVFAEDVQFNSPSQAATIIAGSNQDGPKVFGLPHDRPTFESSEEHYEYYSIESENAIEGYKIDSTTLSSHRNKSLSDQRKQTDNQTCQACGFQLEISGKYVIECHHLKPLSDTDITVTSLEDLVSLCPTCHRITHMRKPPYTVQEIATIIEKEN